jgi:hypothetical protein
MEEIMKAVLGIAMIVALIALVMFLPAIVLSLLLTQLGIISVPRLDIWECWCLLGSIGICGTAFNGINSARSKS